MQYVKIPRERVAVLVGEKGGVKRGIEERTNTRIKIEDTSVSIECLSDNTMNEWIVKDIVSAIGRGFNPETALRLLKEGFILEVLYLRDYVNTPKAIERIKGRVIGERGRARRVIEELTDTHLSVYGKTIAVIGAYDDVHTAKEAVIRLIEGSRHSSVYRFLEKNKSQHRISPWNLKEGL